MIHLARPWNYFSHFFSLFCVINLISTDLSDLFNNKWNSETNSEDCPSYQSLDLLFKSLNRGPKPRCGGVSKKCWTKTNNEWETPCNTFTLVNQVKLFIFHSLVKVTGENLQKYFKIKYFHGHKWQECLSSRIESFLVECGWTVIEILTPCF